MDKRWTIFWLDGTTDTMAAEHFTRVTGDVVQFYNGNGLDKLTEVRLINMRAVKYIRED